MSAFEKSDQDAMKDDGDDVEAHQAMDGSAMSALGGAMAADDEGDDVEAHSALANSAMGHVLGGDAMRSDDEADDSAL